jgi:xanthine/CO dehydrogenase XdhC/CoxF family maturation factor
MLQFLDDCRRRRTGAIVASVIRTERDDLTFGDHLLFDPAALAHGIARGGRRRIDPELFEAVQATARERRSRLVHLSAGGASPADADLFVEWVAPPQRLFLFGSGQDVVPVASIAAMLGWSVTVADTRASWLEPSRFPGAQRLFRISSLDDIAQLEIGCDDAVVLMTHNFPQDLVLLPQVLAAGPRYVGVLGSRSRAERLFEQVGADVDASNVHAPVGLHLGGDQPESIALAIAAELQAVLHDQHVEHLSRRRGAIHAPALEVGVTSSRAWDPRQSIHPVCELAVG